MRPILLESGKFLLVESEIQENSAWNLESKTMLDSLTWGRSYPKRTNLDRFSGKTAHVILIVRGAEKLQPSSLNLNILSTDRRHLHTNPLRQVGEKMVCISQSLFLLPRKPKGKTKENFQFERNSQSTVEPSHVVVKLTYAPGMSSLRQNPAMNSPCSLS